MRKKVGWLWISGAILLFVINFFTLANLNIITVGWAGMASTLIGFLVCPILLFVGIGVLILGEKDR